MSSVDVSTAAGRRVGLLRVALASTGVAGVIVGMVLLALPGHATALTPTADTSAFVRHIAEARGASLLGLGIVALALLREREAQRSPLLPALFLTAILGGFVDLFALRAGLGGLVRVAAVVAAAAWAVAFGHLLTVRSEARRSLPGAARTPLWESATIATFVAFTLCTGLAWVLAPEAFTDTVAGVAGPEPAYAGQVRGVADVAFALAVWSVRHRDGSVERCGVMVAAFVANTALSLVGLAAQLSELATPSRWVVELLHMAWAAAFAASWWRADRDQRAR